MTVVNSSVRPSGFGSSCASSQFLFNARKSIRNGFSIDLTLYAPAENCCLAFICRLSRRASCDIFCMQAHANRLDPYASILASHREDGLHATKAPNSPMQTYY